MRPLRRRGIIGLATAALLAAACSGASLPPPLEGGSQAASSPASAGPQASDDVAGSGAPSGAPSGPVGLSAAEAQLFASLRPDARVNCASRTADLPAKATAGIECTVGSDLVDRVGVYAFATPADALAAYVARMAGYGVALRSGDCTAGSAGDRAWTPGDGPDEGGDVPARTGCFVDENGHANIRVVCGLQAGEQELGRYVGVLGSSTQIRPLLDWVESYADGVEMPVPTPPGICMGG